MTAADEGLLDSVKPSFADSIPELYKDSEDRWYGEMLLPEVIMYNSAALKKKKRPKIGMTCWIPNTKGKSLFAACSLPERCERYIRP